MQKKAQIPTTFRFIRHTPYSNLRRRPPQTRRTTESAPPSRRNTSADTSLNLAITSPAPQPLVEAGPRPPRSKLCGAARPTILEMISSFSVHPRTPPPPHSEPAERKSEWVCPLACGREQGCTRFPFGGVEIFYFGTLSDASHRIYVEIKNNFVFFINSIKSI